MTKLTVSIDSLQNVTKRPVHVETTLFHARVGAVEELVKHVRLVARRVALPANFLVTSVFQTLPCFRSIPRYKFNLSLFAIITSLQAIQLS